MKSCSKKNCVLVGQMQPLENFHKEKRGKFGVRSICKNCDRVRKINYYQNNLERYSETNKLWFERHRKERQEYEKKRGNLPQRRIANNIRTRMRELLKGDYISSVLQYIGCSLKELKCHFEKLWYINSETAEMMSWENYGFYGWHIDHIVPFDSFDLTDKEQLRKVCHYTNLQPLWMKENLSKGSKHAN